MIIAKPAAITATAKAEAAVIAMVITGIFSPVSALKVGVLKIMIAILTKKSSTAISIKSRTNLSAFV